MKKLKEKLDKILMKDERFVDEENNEVDYIKVKDLADKIDEKLIELLISDKELKEKFFTKIKDVFVFNIQDFKFFLDENKLNNSYTKYTNKIGLADRDDFLKDKSEVVLDFPFKDCVLEGGQSNEDGTDTYFEFEEEKKKTVKGEKVVEPAGYKEKQRKRKEIFFNQVLAQDEIDRLFDRKALTNWRKYTKDNLKGDDKFSIERDENGTIKDNLVIKGNNLIALHSLKSEFAGKVKLVYIDPPYNTGNDGFKYNDNFNHSTWLCFMKNRLEVVRDLLSDDGVIFVQCDDNEQAYLKVLMDDIFERENFVEVITVVNNPRGRDYGGVANMHEFINIFGKTNKYSLYPLEDKNKVFPYKDSLGDFETRELRNRNTLFNDKNRPNLCYPFYLNPEKQDENGFLEISLEKKKGFIEVYPTKSAGIQTVWRWGQEKAKKDLNINICGKAMKEKGRYQIVEKYRKNTRMARSVWWDKEVNSERGTLHLKNLFNEKKFNNPKPEETLNRIIEMSTKENDIVLDFFGGSGTTGAVAHKMNRQYILIEQMDYINDLPEARLKKVIEGEQGGISKAVDWQGGGSFIYCELAEWNEQAKNKINACESLDELKKLFKELKEKYFLHYNLSIKEFEEKTIEEKEFTSLSLSKQKKMFLTMLDLNQLYINRSEVEDAKFGIGKNDVRLTEDFYNEK